MNKQAEIISWPKELPDRRRINGDLEGARNVTMQALIGLPRSTFSKDCQDATNSDFVKLLTFEDVGSFRVRGLRPAVESLRQILSDVRNEDPSLFDRLGSAGMLCCRWVRGSASVMSNHSWGTAIDLTIDGLLDPRGDDKVQRGLLQLYPHFNRHGWFWGAAFGTEDCMHFEASEQLIRRWAAEGRFGSKDSQLGLTVGDRGAKVEELQEALNARLGFQIQVDGRFGVLTHAAVVNFQKRERLIPDGIAGVHTLKALNIL